MIREDAPAQLVKGYESGPLAWSVRVCGIHKSWPAKYNPEGGYGIWYEGMEVKDGSISSSDDDSSSEISKTDTGVLKERGAPV